MSSFAQFKSFQNNEFWLQSVNTNNEKFPVPVTVEIDRFMLNYLEQPDIISSRSTATLQDERNGSEDTNKPTDSDSFSSSDDSSSEIESEVLQMNSPGNKTPISVESETIVMKSSSVSQKEEQRAEGNSSKSGKLTPFQQDLNSPKEVEDSEKTLPGDFESKLKDKLVEVARNDLETIEEKHEEDHEMFTRGDLDYVDKMKIKPLKIELASTNIEKLSPEDSTLRDNNLKTANQLTTIVLTEASPKSKQLENQIETESNEIFSQKKPETGNDVGALKIDIAKIVE